MATIHTWLSIHSRQDIAYVDTLFLFTCTPFSVVNLIKYVNSFLLFQDGSHSFLRAARSGNMQKVLEHLQQNTDINTANAVSAPVFVITSETFILTWTFEVLAKHICFLDCYSKTTPFDSLCVSLSEWIERSSSCVKGRSRKHCEWTIGSWGTCGWRYQEGKHGFAHRFSGWTVGGGQGTDWPQCKSERTIPERLYTTLHGCAGEPHRGCENLDG